MYNKTQFFGSKTTVDNFNQSYRRVIMWKDNFNKLGKVFFRIIYIHGKKTISVHMGLPYPWLIILMTVCHMHWKLILIDKIVCVMTLGYRPTNEEFEYSRDFR